jgi:hypothetical protein
MIAMTYRSVVVGHAKTNDLYRSGAAVISTW